MTGVATKQPTIPADEGPAEGPSALTRKAPPPPPPLPLTYLRCRCSLAMVRRVVSLHRTAHTVMSTSSASNTTAGTSCPARHRTHTCAPVQPRRHYQRMMCTCKLTCVGGGLRAPRIQPSPPRRALWRTTWGKGGWSVVTHPPLRVAACPGPPAHAWCVIQATSVTDHRPADAAGTRHMGKKQTEKHGREARTTQGLLSPQTVL